MPGSIISLTNGVQRITSGTNNTVVLGSNRQFARDSPDVLDCRQLDVVIWVVNVESTSSLTVKLWTSLTNTQEDLSTNAGWTAVYTSASLSATNVVVTTITSGLLRYLRWEISTFSGTAINLQISAVART